MFGYDDSSASSLNENRHVVGSLSGNVAGHWRAFIWLPETAYGGLSSGMHFLTSLPVGSARCASAHAINNAGQIVGISSSDSGHPNRATLWLNESPGTFTPHDLGDLGGGASNAYGINELGQVVGASATASQGSHSFLWLEEEAYGLPVGMNDLGSLGDDSEALGVNNHGQVVGRYFPAGQVQSHAFIWENGVMTDLNDFLPQDFLGYVESAHGINDTGHIVGNVVVGLETHAFVMVPEPSAFVLTSIARSGTTAELVFSVSDGSNVDVYKSLDLQDFTSLGVPYASDQTSPYQDASATEDTAFYILVPTGQPLPTP